MKILTEHPKNVSTKPIAEFIFAHGAGANKDSDFMRDMTIALLELNIQVVRFDFPYMLKAVETGKRYPPNKMSVLQDDFANIITRRDRSLPLFIGGKSMGGRVATMLNDYNEVNGIICFGYPFHPPGKPEKKRTSHLYDFDSPLLILQGERDTFGKKSEIDSYQLPDSIDIIYLTSADHSFKPLKSSQLTLGQHIQSAAKSTLDFINENL